MCGEKGRIGREKNSQWDRQMGLRQREGSERGGSALLIPLGTRRLRSEEENGNGCSSLVALARNATGPLARMTVYNPGERVMSKVRHMQPFAA